MTYTDENRGHLQNEERAKQIIEFAGMKYGNCTPTDVDGLIEKNNKAFVLFEIKHNNADVPHGQKLALTRLVDSIDSIEKKEAVLFIGRHEIDDVNKNVVAADTEVTDVYFKGRWYQRSGKTLKEMVDNFMKWAILS